MEAITNLKELRGSDRTSIFMYIEVTLPLGIYVSLGFAAYLIAVKFQENFKTPLNMKRHVAVRLKHLSSNGTLVKVNTQLLNEDSLLQTLQCSHHFQMLTCDFSLSDKAQVQIFS